MVDMAMSDPNVVAEFVDVTDLFDDEDVGGDVEIVEQPETPARVPKESDDAKLVDDDVDPEIEALLGGLVPKPVEKKTPPTPIEAMNKRHARAMIGGKAVVLTFRPQGKVDFGTMADLNTYYANKRVPTAKSTEPISAMWQRDPERRSYPNGVVFMPGKTRPGAYNLWQGFAVEPNPKGSCDLFLTHIRENVCNNRENEYRYLLGWLAHMIQKPGEKPKVAVILRGLKGTGKDTVADYTGKLFPGNHVTISQMDQLTGKFNAYQENALLLHVQEGSWAGDHKAVGPLNRLIMEDSITIERKGMDAVILPNVSRIFISSKEKRVIRKTADERRYAVFDVSNAHLQDRPYFEAIWAQGRNGGFGALLHFLQTYDLSNFDVGVPPQTKGLEQQKLTNLEVVKAWWLERLTYGKLPQANEAFDEGKDWSASWVRCGKEALFADYVQWAKGYRFKGGEMLDSQFSLELREFVPTLGDTRPTINGERVRCFRVPPLEDCRAMFAKKMDIPQWQAAAEAEDDLDDDIKDLI